MWHALNDTDRLVEKSSQQTVAAPDLKCWLKRLRVGVVVRRGRCQLKSRPRLLAMVQNSEVCRQKPSSSSSVRR
ncbi:hypothetical protein TNCV_4314091 [Trichonephila clavipes]|nr:hypothetical protein TNCV_4314091 [Trichonephila clavipes]